MLSSEDQTLDVDVARISASQLFLCQPHISRFWFYKIKDIIVFGRNITMEHQDQNYPYEKKNTFSILLKKFNCMSCFQTIK